MLIWKTFTFDAVHHLSMFPEGHKCRRPHGHTYTLEVYVSGTPDGSGIILDYGDLADIVRPVLEELDHRDLNTVPGLANPTTEHLIRWLWTRLAARMEGVHNLARLVLRASSTTGAIATCVMSYQTEVAREARP